MATNNVETTKSSSIIKVILKKLPFVILSTVLIGLIGFGYGVKKVKPVYTATTSVILRMSVGDVSTGASSGAKSNNDTTLSKLYLPTVTRLLKSNAVRRVSGVWGAVTTSYDTDSLIFSVSYAAESEEKARNDLKALIETFNSEIKTLNEGEKYIMGKDISLQSLENDKHPRPILITYDYTNYIIIGAAIGFVLSTVITFLIYLLDNTVKDREEMERLTGVSVIALIDKDKTLKK